MKEKIAVEITRYAERDRQRWDNFVAQSRHGTLFHTRSFLAYHSPGRFQDHSLLFSQDGNLLAVLPAAGRTHAGAHILHSHPGASFGGFVAVPGISLLSSEAVVARFLQHCRAQGFAGAELTLTPSAYAAHPHHHFEYSLYRNGFRYRKREMTSMVALAEPFAFWPREAKRAARRAQKRGVQITASEAWQEFYSLLQAHMWQRHQVRPTHTLEELLRLRELCPQQLRLFAAFAGSEMIAGMLLFLCNAHVAMAFYYLSHREGFEEYHGFALLCAEVLQWCRQQGMQYLDLGTYTIASQPNWGLADFKESWGGLGVLRDTMFIEFSQEN